MHLQALCLSAIVVYSTVLANHDVNAQDLPIVRPANVGMSREKLADIEGVVDGLIAEKKLAGASVMIARHGQVCFFETYGQMDIERVKEMRKDTIFRIYSMSKAIATTAVMQLIEQGEISADDPVGNYIPDFKEMTVFTSDGIQPAKNAITIAHLMTHTSGLVYNANGEYGELIKQANALDRNNTLEQMTAKMGQTPLKFEPGTDWDYGTSIDVLGRLVEVVSGQSFDVYLEEHIFQPLGMKDTAFYVPADRVERFAANYQPGFTLIDDPEKSAYLKQPALLSGGGGLVSTMSDYMRFLLAIRNGGELDGQRILNPATVELMTENHVPSEVGWIKFGPTVRDGIGFGYGFDVTVEPSRFDPHRHVGDYGWGGAASTHYWCSPEDDLIVVTMEQTMPYTFLLEDTLKPVISAAIDR